MTMIAGRRAVLAGLGLTALSACGGRYVPPDRDATGAAPGGTAAGPEPEPAVLAANEDRPSEGGIGGTGIVGTFNGFGSLLVNGLRIATPDGLSVSDAFGARTLADLALGKSLTIEAAQAGGTLSARRVFIAHPLIGTVEQAGAGRLRCLGISLSLEPGSPLLDADGAAFIPAAGDRVAISGHWRGERIVATRVDRLSDDGPDVIAGALRESVADGPGRLGGVKLGRLGGVELVGSGLERPAAGGYVTARGRYEGGSFLVSDLDEGRFTGAAGNLTRLSVEGYLETVPGAPGYSLSGLGHGFDAEARLAALESTRAIFTGPYEGTFKVSHGLPLPERAAARRQVLAELEDPFAPKNARSTR